MYNIKCFWAGHLVSESRARDDQEVAEKVADLKRQIEAQEISFTSCGHTFVLTELCVDVMKIREELTATHNLKVK